MSDPQPPAPQPEPAHGAAAFPPPPPSGAPAQPVQPAPPAQAPQYGEYAPPAQVTPPVPPYGQPPQPVQAPQFGEYAPPAQAAPPVPPYGQYGAPTPPVPPAPGYVQPGAPSAYPGAWTAAPAAVRPLRGVGATARWLMLVYAAFSLITIAVDAWGIGALTAYDQGSAGIEALNAYDAVSIPLSIVALIVLLAAAVFWVVWQYRAAASLPAGSLRRSPGWHVGSWFIPIVSLFFPFQNVSDLARASQARLTPGIRGAWWALWISANFVSAGASRLMTSADSTAGLSGALGAAILGEVLVIGAAVLGGIVVSRITDAIDPARR